MAYRPTAEDLAQYGNLNEDNMQQESFISKLPRNIMIGLTHLGRNLHNLPHDIAQAGEYGLGKIGEQLKDAIPQIKGMPQHQNPTRNLSSYLPYDTQDYADVFGQKGSGELSDKIMQGLIEHSPELIGLRGIIKAGIRKFPFTQKMGARQLRDAERLGINTPIEVSEELLTKASPFLPKTYATQQMLESVRGGEYKPAFSLQSQIGHHERALRKSPLAAERLLAPEARELKESILKNIENSLRTQGQHEAADLLKGGITDYKKYIKIRDEVFPILKKLGIPTSVLAFVGTGKVGAKKATSALLD